MEVVYKLKTKLQKIQKDNLEYVLNFDEELFNLNISSCDKTLIINFETEANEQAKREQVLKIVKAYDLPIELKDKIIFSNINPYAKQKDDGFFEELIRKKIVYKEMEGVYIYFGIMQKLYGAFSNLFRQMCLNLGAEEIYIPSLLSKKTLDKTEYVKKNKKLCNFVYHGQCNYEMDGILNPAACQPIYKTLDNINKDKILTGFARVYRYESQNYKELSRLREYGIRELICVSDQEGVKKFKNKCIKMVKDLIMKLNLTASIEVASDMFFESDFIPKSTYQISTGSKLEIRLQLDKNESIAGGSLNTHNDFFAKAWGITYNDEIANTFCLGFGVERWCYAILCQYGYNEEYWPIEIRRLIEHYAR